MDNIVVTSNNPDVISWLKSHLHLAFSIKDLGPLSFFLGHKLTYSRSDIILTQQNLVKNCFEILVLLLSSLMLHLFLQTINCLLMTLLYSPTLSCIVASLVNSTSSLILAQIFLIMSKLLVNICKSQPFIILRLLHIFLVTY